jgi:hypothetical protein
VSLERTAFEAGLMFTKTNYFLVFFKSNEFLQSANYPILTAFHVNVTGIYLVMRFFIKTLHTFLKNFMIFFSD